MLRKIQNKCDVVYRKLPKLLKAIYIAIKYVLIQILIGALIDYSYTLITGTMISWGRFGILALALQMCTVAYTILYSLYFTYVKKWTTTFFIPYLLYALLVYLTIVQNNDWDFSRVGWDEYMAMGMMAPSLGVVVLFFRWLVYRYIGKDNVVVVCFRILFNILTLLVLVLVLWRLVLLCLDGL